MRKVIVIVLVLFGGILGFWLARQNQKLFELPFSQEQLQNSKTSGPVIPKKVEIGMDMWQVMEILGPPKKRVVISEKPGLEEEAWTYEKQHLQFENGRVNRIRER